MSPWIQKDDQPSNGGPARPALLVVKNREGRTEYTFSEDGFREVHAAIRKTPRWRLHQDGLALAWRLTRRLPRSWRKRLFKQRQAEKDFEAARRQGWNR